MRALRCVASSMLLAACAGSPPPSSDAPAAPVPTARASSAIASTAPPPSTSPSSHMDAGTSTGHVDDGVIAKIFDRVGELIAARIRQAAGVKYASRKEAEETLDKLLDEWTHFSGMTDIMADVGVRASEVEAFIEQHPEVLKRQAARIAERMREPMHDFEEAIDKQFPRDKRK